MRTIIVWVAVLIGIWPSAFAQTALNMSQDLVRLGIASSNMVPNQPALDAGPLFLKAVQYAQRAGVGSVIADSGAYYFLSEQQPFVAVSLNQISNLTIDFQGSDLYFGPENYGIILNNCSNVILENFTADHLQLLYTQLLVTAVNAAQRQIQFSVQPGWQKPSALNVFLNNPALVFATHAETDVFVFRNGKPWASYTRMPVQQPFADDQIMIAPDFFTSSAIIGQIRPGDVAVLTVRVGGNVIVAGCTGCTFRNIRVYSGLVGFNLQGPSSSSLVERVYVMPKPGTDRLISTIADGITMTQPGPDNTVRLCRAIRTLDDAISPHTWVFASVQSSPGTRALQVQGSYATALAQFRPLPNGSNVVFERPSDGALLGNATVTSQSPTVSVGGIPQTTLNFDRDLPSNLIASYIYSTDANWRAGGLRLERNTVQEQGFARGMSLWGLMNTTVTGNYIRRPAMTGIHIVHSMNTGDWQVPPVANLTVQNNVIDGSPTVLDGYSNLELAAVESLAYQSNGSPMAGGLHQNLTVAGNFIADASRSAVFIGNTTIASVSGNYLLHPNSNPVPSRADQRFIVDLNQPVAVELSSNVATSNNTIDQSSGRMWVTDTQYRELTAYAPASMIRLNAYNLGAGSNPAVTIQDADGNTAALKIQTTSSHAVDVQLPVAAALGGAYLTLTAGSVKYFGTLFLDSADNLPALNGCTYEISPSATSAAAGGSSLPILVVTQGGCSYQVLATDSFVKPAASATGTAVISVAFTANSGAARSTTIEVAGQPITITQAAVLPTIQAIVDSWDYTAGVAPGAWVTITGTALAGAQPQTWNLNGAQQLPTMLGGVAVTFNGTPAALYYVSATQINALVPSSVQPGAVSVVVQSNGVSSSSFPIVATATLPSIYALPNATGSAFFVTAALQGTGFLVGNSAVDPRVLRAAHPGDILDLYMGGLGATAEPANFITNRVFAGAYPVSANVSATVGGDQAQVLFAGLTSPGLYLVRIALPLDLAAGPQPIRISAGGGQTNSSLVLAVSAPHPNLIQNGDFELPLTGSWLSAIDGTTGAAATIQRTTSMTVEGSYSVQVAVTTAAAHTSANSPCLDCAVQFWQTGLALQQSQVYTLQFWAKADTARTMRISTGSAGPPFQNYGLSTAVAIGGDWQRYVIYFQATATDQNGRLTFYFGDQAGITWLDSIVLQGSAP